MKFKNPFTIKFGGDSDLFFGRHEQLVGFDNALVVSGSDYRATFITGSRGMGKTSLLEQYSIRAHNAGWEVIDAQPEEALKALHRHFAPYDEEKKTLSVKPTINTPFGGGSLGEKGSEKTVRSGDIDLSTLFIRYCEDHPQGVFVSIDETQKMPLDDLSLICGAFQMASRKGYNVILAIAGLPTSYEVVIQHKGCTFMRRANHIQLGLFSRAEVEEAYRSAFGLVNGLTVDDNAFKALVSFSKGQPYMVQLLGYYAVEYASTNAKGKTYRLSHSDANHVKSIALDTYEKRVLAPLMAEVRNGEREFLNALAKALGEDRRARTGEVAEAQGKTTTEMSMTRKRLLEEKLIDAPAHGYVRFAVPYLREYLLKEESQSDASQLLDDWDV